MRRNVEAGASTLPSAGGGTGRRRGLKIPRITSVRVRFPPRAPTLPCSPVVALHCAALRASAWCPGVTHGTGSPSALCICLPDRRSRGRPPGSIWHFEGWGGMDGAVQGIDASPLALLGFGDVEERVYRALLKRHRASAALIADDLAITLDDATGLLEHLESLGLGTHTLESPKTYVSVEPELAIDALIKQRQRTLEQARTVVPMLAKAFAHASLDHAGQQPVIELITDRAQLGQVLVQMYQSAQTELVAFQKVPIILPSTQITSETATDAVVRTISDECFLEAPGVLELLRNDMAHGEQARTFSRLPFKMMIADRRIAVITLDAQNPEAPTLLIH